MVKTILWGPLFLSPCKDQGTYKEEKICWTNLQLSKYEFEDYILEFEEEIKRALRRVDFRKAGNWESAVVELFYAQLLEKHHEYLMGVFDQRYS